MIRRIIRYEFLYDGTVGAEILDDRVILNFVDGELGDEDLTVKGIIVDDNGPADSFAWQNDLNRSDVNDRDGATAPDALIIINYIGANFGSDWLPAPPATPPSFYDVTSRHISTQPSTACRSVSCSPIAELGCNGRFRPLGHFSNETDSARRLDQREANPVRRVGVSGDWTPTQVRQISSCVRTMQPRGVARPKCRSCKGQHHALGP